MIRRRMCCSECGKVINIVEIIDDKIYCDVCASDIIVEKMIDYSCENEAYH